MAVRDRTAPLDRHRSALDEFYEQYPQAAEAVFVTAESFERGVFER